MQKVFYSTNIGGIDRIGNVTKYGISNFVMYGFGGPSIFDTPFLYKINNSLDSIATKSLYPNAAANDQFAPYKGNLICTRSNYFLMCGTYATGLNYSNQKAFVMKTDTNLTMQWKMRVPQIGTTSSRIFELEDDTLFLVSTELASNRIWLYKILQDSTIVSTTMLTSTIGGLGEIRSAVLKRNGVLAICGDAGRSLSAPYTAGSAYVCVIQTNSRPVVVTETKESFVEALAKSSILFYPNPAKETLNYESSTTGELLLQDASGKIVKDVGIRERKGSISILGLAVGSYTYRFTTRSFMESGKLVVE